MKMLNLIALLGLSALCFVQAAAGATIRVNCNNNSGDAALINAAITGSAAGDEIVINGPALINAPISLLGDRTYRGESRTGTVLKQANNANLVAVLASASYLSNSTTTGNPITVWQLTVDGNKANNTNSTTIGVILRNRDSVAEDLFITNMGGDGIRVTNPSANGTALTGNQSYGLIQNCFINSSGGHGVYAKDTGNKMIGWDIIDNWIAGSGDTSDSINVENANNWIIERNHLYGVHRHGIYADRAYNASISDNYVEGFGETTNVGTYYGVAVGLNGGATSYIYNNHVYNFGGEQSATSTYHYVSVVKVNYGTGTAEVVGNLVRGTSTTSASYGLYYAKGAGTALTVNYKGNQISNVTTPRFSGTGVTIVSQNSGL